MMISGNEVADKVDVADYSLFRFNIIGKKHPSSHLFERYPLKDLRLIAVK
jgi:hypothetical protein